jgi:putative membrane protein
MSPSGRSLFSVVRRVAALWIVEVAALWLLARLLPGLTIHGWDAAILGVAAIGLLNALVRPVLLYLTLPFTVISFGLLTLVLNAVILWIASLVVPGMHLAGFGAGVIAALGLSVTNTVAASLLAFEEEDSVYRNIVRRIAGRAHAVDPAAPPGLIMIEFDGLSAPLLEHAMNAGYMPTLESGRRTGRYRVARWDCGVPSQTSSSQAGILFGNNFDIPGFRWFEKATGKTVVSNDPSDAMQIEHRVSRGAGLLRDDGISVCNMFTGDAEKSIATISTFSSPARQVRRTSATYFSFYLNPYNFTRLLVLMVWDIVVEKWESARQRARRIRPRVSRGGSFALLRAMSTVVQRDLGTYTLMREMFAGVPIAYITYVGYDVVAHHAGPERIDALRVLRSLDRRVAMLARAARDAPRPYRFVFLSDHGQTRSIPFRQKYGVTVDAVVRDLLATHRTVHAPVVETEGWGHLNALLTEAIGHDRLSGRAARRLLRRRTREGYVELGASKRGVEGGDVVVCSSGNLAHIYFREPQHRLTLEEIAADYPGLIEGLVAHAGIGFVIVRSSVHGPVVLGSGGVRYLREHRVDGDDPLDGYGDRVVEHLVRLEQFPHCGDVVLNGRYHPETGVVESFEEMVGSHGGIGGPQTEPFLMHPAGWHLPDGPISNAEQMYQLLVRWRDTLAQGEDPGAARLDASHHDAL